MGDYNRDNSSVVVKELIIMFKILITKTFLLINIVQCSDFMGMMMGNSWTKNPNKMKNMALGDNPKMQTFGRGPLASARQKNGKSHNNGPDLKRVSIAGRKVKASGNPIFDCNEALRGAIEEYDCRARCSTVTLDENLRLVCRKIGLSHEDLPWEQSSDRLLRCVVYHYPRCWAFYGHDL